LLPVAALDDLVTLGEGNTPLVPSVQLGTTLELEHCYLKNETMNPVGAQGSRSVHHAHQGA
jgi:threonine synthase